MKVVALLSGGKDSILSLVMAYRYHHEPVVAANIAPSLSVQQEGDHELDSYMYQTVGHEAVEDLVSCLGIPLRRATVERHRALDQSLHYTENFSEDDEVEDLYRLLLQVKQEFPEVEGVTSGAILSNYQRHRVEYVCDRLGLVSIAYLWRRPAREILDMASSLSTTAIIVKCASAGLIPSKLLGRTLEEARPTLEKMETLYGGHMAGEGGEFESFVLDTPLFTHHYLKVTKLTPVVVDDNEFSPSGHCILHVERIRKTDHEQEETKNLLTRLRRGLIEFPSDTLPLLRSLPALNLDASSAGCTVASPHVVGEWSALSLLDGRGGTIRVVTESTLLCDLDSESSVAPLVLNLFRDVQDLAAQQQAIPFYYCVEVRESKGITPFIRKAYAQVVSAIKPPGCSIFVLPKAGIEEGTVRISALCSLLPVEDVVHNQSWTCWAAGARGPQSQAWRLKVTEPSDEEADESQTAVLVAGIGGVVPTTGRLATGESVDVLKTMRFADPRVADFAAQFAFAVGNAAQYGDLFGQTMSAVRTVVCIVSSPEYMELLPQLFAWCGGLPPDAKLEVMVAQHEYNGKLIEVFMIW